MGSLFLRKERNIVRSTKWGRKIFNKHNRWCFIWNQVTYNNKLSTLRPGGREFFRSEEWARRCLRDLLSEERGRGYRQRESKHESTHKTRFVVPVSLVSTSYSMVSERLYNRCRERSQCGTRGWRASRTIGNTEVGEEYTRTVDPKT